MGVALLLVLQRWFAHPSLYEYNHTRYVRDMAPAQGFVRW